MNFVDMLMYFARSNPEKQAIILPDRIVSFGMIGAGIRSVEAAIAEASLDSRHVVAVRIDKPHAAFDCRQRALPAGHRVDFRGWQMRTCLRRG